MAGSWRGEARRTFLARFFLSLRCLRAVVLALPIPNCGECKRRRVRRGRVARHRGAMRLIAPPQQPACTLAGGGLPA